MTTLLRRLLLTYLVIEVLAYIRYLRVQWRFAAYHTQLPPRFNVDKWASWLHGRLRSEVKRSPKATEALLSDAFWGTTPVLSLRRRNVKAWLYFFTTTRESWEPTKTDRHAYCIERTLQSLEEGLGGCFPDEGGSDCDFIRVNNNVRNHTPPSPVYMPVPVQGCRALARWCGSAMLGSVPMLPACLGLQRHTCTATGIVYWSKPMGGHNQSTKGLLFLHGFGLGAVPYIPMIRDLLEAFDSHRMLIVPEMPLISGHSSRQFGQGYTCSSTVDRTPYPRSDEICASIARMMRRLGCTTMDVLGHSYGGIVTNYLTNQMPEIVERACLLEVAAFLPGTTAIWPKLFHASSWCDLVEPCLARDWSKIKQALMQMVVTGEPGHQYVIHNCMWFMDYINAETFPADRTLLILGECDEMTRHEEVQSYLSAYHPTLQVRVIKGGGHGHAAFGGRAEVLQIVQAFFGSPSA